MGGFVGLKTFERATDNFPFSQAIKNSLLWGVVGLFVPTIIGLVAAALVEDTNLRPQAPVSVCLLRALFLFNGGGGRALHSAFTTRAMA